MVFCKRKGTRNAYPYLQANKLKFLECVHWEILESPSNVSPLWLGSCLFWRISILFPRKLRQQQLQVVSFLELPTNITISPKNNTRCKGNEVSFWWQCALVVTRRCLTVYCLARHIYVLVKISCKQQFRNCNTSLSIKMSLFWKVNRFWEKCRNQLSPKYLAWT